MYKLLFGVLAVFCFLHAIRDYLQIKGVKNWFTEIGHIWVMPKYEVHSLIVFLLFGILFAYLFIK